MTIPGFFFSDYVVIIAESPKTLQEDMRKRESRRPEWNMSLNLIKCYVVVYASGENVNCTVSGATTPVTQQYTYLISQRDQIWT